MVRRIPTMLLGVLLLVMCVAAFGAHQMYLEPDMRAPFVRNAVDRFYPVASMDGLTIDERLEDVYACEDRVWTILIDYGRQPARSRVEAREQTARLLDRISAHRAVIESENASSQANDYKTAAGIVYLADLRATFAAAQFAPGLHQENFRSLADASLADDSQSNAAILAQYLHVFAAHDYAAPATDACQSDLLRFALDYPQSRFAPLLFSTVSREFWRNGQGDSARQVLELGVETFRGQSTVGVLIGQLANQQLSESPDTFDSHRPETDWQGFAESLDPTRTWNISPMP